MSNDTVGLLVGIVSLAGVIVACTKYIVGSVGTMAAQIVGLQTKTDALEKDVDRHERVIEGMRAAHGGAE